MKRYLALLFAIFSLSILFNVGMDRHVAECNDQTKIVISTEQGFSQTENFIDLNAHRGGCSSSNISPAYTQAKSSTPKRNTLTAALAGVNIAIANLASERSYIYSCNFPFDHLPQKRLFFILRNIRI